MSVAIQFLCILSVHSCHGLEFTIHVIVCEYCRILHVHVIQNKIVCYCSMYKNNCQYFGIQYKLINIPKYYTVRYVFTMLQYIYYYCMHFKHLCLGYGYAFRFGRKYGPIFHLELDSGHFNIRWHAPSSSFVKTHFIFIFQHFIRLNDFRHLVTHQTVPGML